jgi:hypothetical protein
MPRLPRLGTAGCVLLSVPFLYVAYFFYTSVACGEGFDCPSWVETPAAAAIAWLCLAVPLIGALYALAERIITGTPQERAIAVMLAIPFVVLIVIVGRMLLR